jgi:formate hydrogenlyase transcriptional activator
MIGSSAAFRNVLRQVGLVAPTEETVLIQGETGTGKEVIANAIHGLSPRIARPLLKLNCAAIPSGLLESELFGHERGAFTGALSQRIGRFESADQGTLFLDEIGDIPLDLQPKLLRVLQEQEFERRLGIDLTRTDLAQWREASALAVDTPSSFVA